MGTGSTERDPLLFGKSFEYPSYPMMQFEQHFVWVFEVNLFKFDILLKIFDIEQRGWTMQVCPWKMGAEAFFGLLCFWWGGGDEGVKLSLPIPMPMNSFSCLHNKATFGNLGDDFFCKFCIMMMLYSDCWEDTVLKIWLNSQLNITVTCSVHMKINI